jgi:hypothetical protein
MDCSSCSFDRVRSRPAMIIKGAKKAAYYPKARCSPQSLARRLASLLLTCRPLRRTTRSSRWRSRPRPTPLAPRQMLLALLRDSATQPRVYPSFDSFPHLAHLSLSAQGLRPNLLVGPRVGTRRQQRTRFRRVGRRRH